jgi:hypothetical protein
MTQKSGLDEIPQTFDLKFLLAGSPGSGKTHMCGTYTGGPIHFYMADPGGEKTLYKLNQDRPAHSPLTIDRFSRQNKDKFSTFWKRIQQDDKDGFFDEMAEKNGLVVFDSGTSLALLALDEVAELNKRDPAASHNPQKIMRIQDWGQRSNWLTEFMRIINELPCAVALCCHLGRDKNEQSGSIIENLNLPGQLKDTAGNWFDEVYKIKTVVKTIRLLFKADGTFDQAKTRVFLDESADFKAGDPIMDQLAKAYFQGGKFSTKGAPGQKPKKE